MNMCRNLRIDGYVILVTSSCAETCVWTCARTCICISLVAYLDVPHRGRQNFALAFTAPAGEPFIIFFLLHADDSSGPAMATARTDAERRCNEPKENKVVPEKRVGLFDFQGLSRAVKGCQGLSRAVRCCRGLSGTVGDCEGL